MKREWLDKIPAYVLGFVVGGVFMFSMIFARLEEAQTKCEEYKRIVSEQSEVIERYKAQNETMIAMIDELLKEGGK